MFIYGSSSPGAIAGGVIGGLVSLAFICAIVCVCVRICKNQNHGKIIVYPQQPTVNTTSRTSLSNIKD